MNIPIFPSNMEILSQDTQNGFNLINTDFQTFINTLIYSADSIVILSGAQVQADSTPDGGVIVTAATIIQNGQIIKIPTNQQVNVLSGSYAWGTALAADTSNPRIDAIICQYQTQTSNVENRPFKDPITEAVTNQNVALSQLDYYALSVAHGTPSSNPVNPAIPAGWFVLAYINVAANATSINNSQISDQTSQYRISGGWLKKASGGRIWVNDGASSEIDTLSGTKFFIGSTAYVFDNNSSGYLEILGKNNGIKLLSVLLASQGITIPTGQSFTNNGSYGGTPVITSLKAGDGITVSNPSAPGQATVGIKPGGVTSAMLSGDAVPNASTTAAGIVKIADAVTGTPVVPIQAAKVSEIQITGTSTQQILSFTPTSQGNFIAHVYLRVTSKANVAVTVTYNDALGVQVKNMSYQVGGLYFPLSSGAQVYDAGSYSLVPLFINATTAGSIIIKVTASIANVVYASADIVGA